jgi:hypothetical protein
LFSGAALDSNAADAAASGVTDVVASAHQKLLQDDGLQFDFSTVAPPAEPPSWLVNLFNFLGRLQPFFEFLFWCGVAIVAALVIFFIGREIWRYRRRESAVVQRPDRLPDWRPPLARARALLADADRLAADGKFAEAVHLLLFRSIDDIDERRPRALRPALTSRDIAVIDALPPSVRLAFGRIAATVERSFFGGRELDAGDFAECRRAYEAFALPDEWSQAAPAGVDLRGFRPA